MTDDFKEIEKMEKAELHIHLEGAVNLTTIQKIARRKKMPRPGDDFYPNSLYQNFEDFSRVFENVLAYFTSEADFFDLGYDFAEHQAKQNIVYTEAYLMPHVHEMMGRDIKAVLEGLDKGLAAGEKDFGVKVRLIYSISRMMSAQAAWATLDYIDKYPISRVVGIDLAGMEVKGSILPFEAPFEKARQMGLLTITHSGEFSGADHVGHTLDILKPSRIGHGIGCCEDGALVRRLVEENVPLDISISSNVSLHAVSSLEAHPVRRLFDQGVKLTLNTDDPALFKTSLTDQYAMLMTYFSFSRKEILQLVRNAFVFSFNH